MSKTTNTFAPTFGPRGEAVRLREDYKPLGEATCSAGMVSRGGRTVKATIAIADNLLYSVRINGRTSLASERHLVDVDARRATRSD